MRREWGGGGSEEMGGKGTMTWLGWDDDEDDDDGYDERACMGGR